MKIAAIINEIENFAPLKYQESYDNCGIQVGNANIEATGALFTLDVTEAVIDEAIINNCNLVIAHHPLIFGGIKNVSEHNTTGKIITKAIKNDIVIYAAHTNLDNVRMGVNNKIAQKIGLIDCNILSPQKNTLLKLYTYVPINNKDVVLQALFNAGAGKISEYSECSFQTNGIGTFKPSENANPTIGIAGGERENVTEVKIEVLVPVHLQNKIIQILKDAHPYEEVAYEIIALQNTNQQIGAGMVGELAEPMQTLEFLQHLQQKMQTNCIRHTAVLKDKIKRIALCGGAGSFLINDAKRAGADIFITADYKYHQFFDADNQIVIADIGHFESEQFTVEIFYEIINKKFPNFATLLSKTKTNPVNYLF